MHDGFAAYLWRCYGSSQLGRAAAHWARGSDVPAFADALRVCSSSALPGEQRRTCVSVDVACCLCFDHARTVLCDVAAVISDMM